MRHQRPQREWSRLRGVLKACLVVGFVHWMAFAAAAVDIQPVWDAGITDAQKAVINTKIALWEQRLPHTDPEHVVTITFGASDLGTSPPAPTPGVELVLADLSRVRAPGPPGEQATLGRTTDFANDANGRPTSATITINNNAAIPWHEDAATDPPADKYDLYTVVNHEMCHALGFTVNNPRFNRNVTTDDTGTRKYNDGGNPTGTLTDPAEGTHLDDSDHPDDLMNPTLPKGTRRTPSQLDEDILEHDVWNYTNIQGTLSNFDVWNRSGFIANDFQVTLGGILDSSVTDVYNGALNPFSNGTVTQNGNNAVVKWGPGPGQVNPGGSAHFGFRIQGDLTPTSFKFEWTQNNTVISTVPVSGQQWRMLTTEPVVLIENRISNDSDQIIWVDRRINWSDVPVALEDLVVGGLLDMTAVPVDPAPIQLLPGESVTLGTQILPEHWGVVVIADYYEDAGGIPGELIGTWLDAAEGPPARLPGDVDGDGCVDVFDVIDVINAFGSTPGDPNWNPGADFDGNGAVDVFDVITVVNNFGSCL